MTRVCLALAFWLLLNPDGLRAAEVDEQTKIEALKLGYILNGNSMVRWGSIDLTAPIRSLTPTPTEKKKDRR